MENNIVMTKEQRAALLDRIGFMPDGSRMFFPTAGEYYDYIEELYEPAALLSA